MSRTPRHPARAWIALILALTGCLGRREPPPRAERVGSSSAAAADSPSRSLLAVLPIGWHLIGTPTVITSPDLPDHLDRDAAYFRDYGVLDVTSVTCADLFDTSIPVEIFRFASERGAFGAWSGRRLRGTPAVNDLGDGAYLGSFGLHVWSGVYYVRLTGDPRRTPALVTLASAVTGTAPRAGRLPAALSFLSSTNRIAGSESFRTREVFGQPLFAGSYTAWFRAGNEEFEGLVFEQSGTISTVDALDTYRTLYGVSGRLLDPIAGLGEESFAGEDRLLGTTVAFRRNRWLVAYRGNGSLEPLVAAARESDEAIRAASAGPGALEGSVEEIPPARPGA